MFNSRLLSLVLLIILTTLGCGGKGKARQNSGRAKLSDTQKDAQDAVRDLGAIVHGSTAVQVRFNDPDKATDEAMARLKAVENLSMVDLSGMRITDDGLRQICEIESITDLDLSGTRITDKGMAYVKNLKKLGTITVGPGVGDEGVAHLAGMKTLTNIRLDGSQVTDACLDHVATCTRLVRLSLGKCNITDQGLAKLKGLKRLVILSMPETNVTDAGLVHLEGHTQMAQIHLFEVKGVTEAGLAKLRRVLKQTDVESGEIRESPLGNPLGGGNPGPTPEQRRAAEENAKRFREAAEKKKAQTNKAVEK